MHQILLLYDTLRLIFGYFVSEDHDISYLPHQCTESAATLYALARTCQTFSDIALDLLWRRLPSPNHLIYCLPCDAYVIGEGVLLVRNGLVIQEGVLVSNDSVIDSILSADQTHCRNLRGGYITTTLSAYATMVARCKAWGPANTTGWCTKRSTPASFRF